MDYGAGWMDAASESRGIWRPDERVFLVRDQGVEDEARARLADLGMKRENGRPGRWTLGAKALPRAVRGLVGAGWHVEAEGKTFRTPGATRVSVSSGIDWFELHGEVDYGEATASLPQLLAAVRRGDTMVVLGDGTFGLLPEEWLERFAPLAGLGREGRRPSAIPAQPGGAAGRAAGGAAGGPRRRDVPSRCASACATSSGVKPACSRRDSSDNCAITSAKASAGWSSCASSASAAAWQTIWAWAKPRRCWPCWKRGAPKARGRRWWWFRSR